MRGVRAKWSGLWGIRGHSERHDQKEGPKRRATKATMEKYGTFSSIARASRDGASTGHGPLATTSIHRCS
eukprot:13689350-Alexandrium_andersonii.AAC.1